MFTVSLSLCCMHDRPEMWMSRHTVCADDEEEMAQSDDGGGIIIINQIQCSKPASEREENVRITKKKSCSQSNKEIWSSREILN